MKTQLWEHRERNARGKALEHRRPKPLCKDEKRVSQTKKYGGKLGKHATWAKGQGTGEWKITGTQGIARSFVLEPYRDGEDKKLGEKDVAKLRGFPHCTLQLAFYSEGLGPTEGPNFFTFGDELSSPNYKAIKQQMSVEMPEKPLSLKIKNFSLRREMTTDLGLKPQGLLQHRDLLHSAVLFISSKSLSGYPLKTALPRAFYWPYSSATYRVCKPDFSTKATQRMFFLHSWYFDNFSRMQIYSRPKSICIAINWECNVATI